MMKTLLRFLLLLLTLHSCGAQELSLHLVTNVPSFHGDFSGSPDSEIVVQVFLQNTGKKKVRVITKPDRYFNIYTLKARYTYHLEGLGERLVVPNPYILMPVVLPGGALARIDEFRIPVSAIRKQLERDHVMVQITYEIDEDVAPWLPVWTGELIATTPIK